MVAAGDSIGDADGVGEAVALGSAALTLALTSTRNTQEKVLEITAYERIASDR